MSASRKIIQIASASETADRYAQIYALCDDGTVWRMVAREPESACAWAPLPNVPQPSEDR